MNTHSARQCNPRYNKKGAQFRCHCLMSRVKCYMLAAIHAQVNADTMHKWMLTDNTAHIQMWIHSVHYVFTAFTMCSQRSLCVHRVSEHKLNCRHGLALINIDPHNKSQQYFWKIEIKPRFKYYVFNYMTNIMLRHSAQKLDSKIRLKN